MSDQPIPSDPMGRYRSLEADLRRVRRNGRGSLAENPILEEMARVWWWELSDVERETLDQEGPTCDPPKEPQAGDR